MRRLLLAATLAVLLLAPSASAWTWPTAGAVLQPFAFDPAHPYSSGQHRGIDVAGDPGSLVAAPEDGVVTFAGSVPSSGKTVTIATPDGYAVTLTHLGSISVTKGATVAEGDGVGTIGPSGDAEVAAPYVHLGIRIAAQEQGYVDPQSLLPPRTPAATPVPAAVSAVAGDPWPPAAPAAPSPTSGDAAVAGLGDPLAAPVMPAPPAAAASGETGDGGTASAPAPAAAPATDAGAQEPAAALDAPPQPAAAETPTVTPPEPQRVAPSDALPAETPAVQPDVPAAAAAAANAQPTAAASEPAALASPAQTTPVQPTASVAAAIASPATAAAADAPMRSAPRAPVTDVPSSSAAAASPDAPAAAAEAQRGSRAVTAVPPATGVAAAARHANPSRHARGEGAARDAAAVAVVAAQRAQRTRARVAEKPKAVLRHRSRSPFLALLGIVAVLFAAVAATLGTARRSPRRPAPIMERDVLLRHDTDLLRERQAAHRSRVHDDRGGHPGAPSPAARRGDLLPHRRRRARDQGVARGGGAGTERSGVRRPDCSGVA
jgi:murein DD-endopeptidase MepM/ murein hydrolase activator NlpD